MIQNVLRNLGGIDVYGVVSLCLFFFVFAAIVAWTFALRRGHLERMAHLPLESEPDHVNNSEATYE